MVHDGMSLGWSSSNAEARHIAKTNISLGSYSQRDEVVSARGKISRGWHQLCRRRHR